jgi:hypothetical protein
MRAAGPISAWTLIVALGAAAGARADLLANLDTFEDGTTQGWVVGIGPGGGGHPAPPANVATGGPAGDDDSFLMLTSVGGLGSGGRLVALNASQWAGDYLGEGVAAIQMDVRNFGTGDLALRLLVEDPGPGPPTNIALSADPVVVAAGGGWARVRFAIGLGAFTAVTGSVEAALRNATILRILHGPTDAFPPDPVVAQLGVDNIQAVVPEPSSVTLAASGLVLLVLGVQRRSRCQAAMPTKATPAAASSL